MLELAMAAVENAIMALTTRVATLETAVAGLGDRVTALEALHPAEACSEGQGIAKQSDVWVCADLAPPPAAEPSGTVKRVFWIWEPPTDPNLLDNDDACGFTQTRDADGDGNIDHWMVDVPPGQEGGLVQYKSVHVVSAEVPVMCEAACTSDPQCAAVVFVRHNQASGEGECTFTRHTIVSETPFTRFCNNPGNCAVAVTVNQSIFAPFTKCDANNP